MIEQLTDEERAALLPRGGGVMHFKALRIIDAQAARIAELEKTAEALRAEVERLRSNMATLSQHVLDLDVAESSLAEARAFAAEYAEDLAQDGYSHPKLTAWLDANPEAPSAPTRTEGCWDAGLMGNPCPSCRDKPTRTDHERAALDACKAIPDPQGLLDSWAACDVWPEESIVNVIRAELARREAAK